MHPPSHPFDLVILDLDGTIIDLFRHGAISARVQQTIAAVQATGVPVTIGTGRTLDYIRQHMAHLGVTQPVIAVQGAVIGDPITGRILHATTIPLASARQIAAWTDASPYIAAFYFNDSAGRTRIYQNRLPDHPVDHEFHEHVFGAPRQIQPTFAELLMAADAAPPLKFMIDNDPQLADDIVPALQARFGNELHITRTHPRLVEGTALGVDKGQGVRHLCAILGIDPQRVMAIGDNDNDISMLATVGFGVAMGNATPGVKAVAQWVAPSVGEDGAAVALERWILNASASD